MSGTTSFSPAGRGGALLPSGYLSTSGSQIVDPSGNVVRINSIGWNQNFANPQPTVDAMKADGFNTIRISWVDATMQSDLQLIDQVVAAARADGMKVILDNHTNETGTPGDGYGAQQKNGLWYDQGGASDGTNGAGVAGTISDATFQADWTAVAQHYAGNDTVVGFDVRNEPLSYPGMSTWGDGSSTDIRAMYQRVGNAIEAADPGVLVIAEGPQNYGGTFSGPPGSIAPEGDLTGVKNAPVTLDAPNKVVYSVHEYPGEVSGLSNDAGAAYVDRMNTDWGYLVSQNIAPVWIGEMGSSMNSADGQAWADTISSYVNGGQAANGGPSTPIGTDWWAWGNLEGQQPDGTLQTDGTPRPEQQAVTDTLLFKPVDATVPPPAQPPRSAAAAASPDQTVLVAGSGQTITDDAGNAWTITSAGQVAVNGSADTTTYGVAELAFAGGRVWQENGANLWWSKSTPADPWGPAGGTASSPLAAPIGNDPAAAAATIVLAGSAQPIADGAGNAWTITDSGQVAVNGTVDATTSGVTELVLANGRIWQQNGANFWWSRSSPADAWGPGAGTAEAPIPQMMVTADQATVTVAQISGVVLGSSGDHSVFVTGSGNTLALTGGAETISDTGGHNTFVVPAAGGGSDTFATDIFAMDDTLDLHAVLKAANWDGQTGTLPSVLTVTESVAGSVLSVTQNGQASAVATFQKQPGLSLSDVLGHAQTI
jgi:endoglucanase